MGSRVTVAQSEQEISDCYVIMAELRPHIQPDEFLPMVKRLSDVAGFQLAYLTDGEIKAVAGFRISEWLAGGKYLEIEDLVAKSGERSKGYGWSCLIGLSPSPRKTIARRCDLFPGSRGSKRTGFTCEKE